MTFRMHLVALAFLLVPAVAQAGPASDAVARFYAHVGKELSPEMRRHFTAAARALLDRNQSAGCVTPGMIVVDAGKYDTVELKRTLELRESVQGDSAIVMAHFRQGGERRALEWTLEHEGKAWLVADVMSLYGDWRLSELSC